MPLEETNKPKKVIRDDGTIDDSLMTFKAKYQTDIKSRKIIEVEQQPERFNTKIKNLFLKLYF